MDGQGQAAVANMVLDLGDNCHINPLDKGMDRHTVLEVRTSPGGSIVVGPPQQGRLGKSRDRCKNFEMMERQ